MKVQELRLKNGLRTLFIDQPGSQMTTAQIWFKAGSSCENKSNQGIAHFLEHMFFKGTKKYPDMMIAKTVESYGGELNAFTSFDYTCYYINAPHTQALTTIDVLMDMVSNPQFLEQDIIPEREVVFEEYRRTIDNPSQYGFIELQKQAFPKTYNHPILGTEKTIKSFSRKQLTEFRDQFYNNENAMLVIAGNVDKKDKLISHIEKFKLPSGKKSKFNPFTLKTKDTVGIHQKHINQASITFSIQSPSYDDPKSAAEDLALNCLAYGDISPLYVDLVSQSSLANSTSGSTMFFANGGCHFLKIGMPFENFHKALNQLYKTLTTTLKRGFETQDIDRIRNQYIASKIYEKESIESFAFSLGHGFAQSGNIYCEDDFIGNMKQVSKAQVAQSLIDIFTRNIHAMIQLPNDIEVKDHKEAVEKFIKKLKDFTSKLKIKEQKANFEVSKHDPEAKLIKLSKNISLLYRRNTMTPTFAFHAYMKGGVAFENQEQNGIYNLISKNLTYGHKFTPFEKLKTELETKASYINGFSGKNAYGLTLHGLSEHADQLFFHFMNTLIKPAFPNHFFKLEKELVNRTIYLQKKDPVKNCFKEFTSLVFNGHPYSMDAVGTEKSIRSISRKKMIDLHHENVFNNEILFTYCGDLDLETLKEKLAPYLDELKNSKRKKIKSKNKMSPKNNQDIQIDFDREQTHIVIGKPAYKVKTNEDLYLKVLTTFLSGQSSELFVEVRDKKGLCYSVQPIHHTAVEGGFWAIYIGAGHDKVELAVDAIFDILKKYAKKGFSQKQLNEIKKMINGQNLIGIQTNDDYANFYSVPILQGLGIDYQYDSFKFIDEINAKDFNAFLREFLDGDWNIIKVGRP